VRFAGLSDCGRVRANNEDTIAFEPALGLAVLADGMGGYQAGEVASAIAVQEVRARLGSALADDAAAGSLEQAVRAAVDGANEAIYATAQRDPGCHGMGTTLVLALFADGAVMIAHIGDSRAYRLRDGCLQALTRDHSLVQEQVDAGLLRPEQARQLRYRNVLTHALGVETHPRFELVRHPLQPGDRYLLCSDGLHDMLSDAQIAAELRRAAGPEAAARTLLDAANQAGGLDNISIIVADCPPDSCPRSKSCPS
jgi:protein phosphatase